MSLLDSMGVTEYQEKRRNAVADNLSRLAFVTSDVVIFIWNGTIPSVFALLLFSHFILGCVLLPYFLILSKFHSMITHSFDLRILF